MCQGTLDQDNLRHGRHQHTLLLSPHLPHLVLQGNKRVEPVPTRIVTDLQLMLRTGTAKGVPKRLIISHRSHIITHTDLTDLTDFLVTQKAQKAQKFNPLKWINLWDL